MEIEKIKQLKRDLEYDILLKVCDFEGKTNQKVSGINVIEVDGLGSTKPKTMRIELDIRID